MKSASSPPARTEPAPPKIRVKLRLLIRGKMLIDYLASRINCNTIHIVKQGFSYVF